MGDFMTNAPGSSGGGSGTVTSFSSGNLSPLFTTAVATATTTPALSFTISNAAAYSAYGNFTSSSAAPGFSANPACTTFNAINTYNLNGNIFLGYPLDSATYDTTGLALGVGVLQSQTGTSSNNTGVGYNAGNAVTSGVNLTFVGFQAGLKITTGSSSTAVGYNALSSAVTNGGNTAIGASALAAGTNTQCTGVGAFALNTTTGSGNTALGYSAGTHITTGGTNLILGPNVATTTLTSGSNNVLIGTSNSIDTAAGSTANTIQIGAGSTAVISATGCGTPSTSMASTAGSFTVGAGLVTKVTIVTGSATVNITSVMQTVIINNTGSTGLTVNLPSPSPPTGWQCNIKDGNGTAGTHALTVTPASGTIEGASTFVMSTNRQSITVQFDGTNYNVI